MLLLFYAIVYAEKLREHYVLGIGGIGGSGTRLVASIVESLNYFIGHDLNEPKDNLFFTLLFKCQNILLLSPKEFEERWILFSRILQSDYKLTNKNILFLKKLAEDDRTLHEKDWLKQRVENAINYLTKTQPLVAFKEPNSHIVVDKIFNIEKDMKYIYVYRNGLDMAYSSNQNQLKLWGKIFFNNYNLEITPTNSLKYWVHIHKRMLDFQNKYPTQIYMLNYDQLCLSKNEELNKLLKFIDISVDETKRKELISLIKPPTSIDRHKNFSLDVFNKEDLYFCQKTMKVANSWDNFPSVTVEDFHQMKVDYIEVGTPVYSKGCKNILNEHLVMLEKEFSKKPIILFYHTWLIVNIRRKININQNKEKYFTLWKTEKDFLIQNLSLRWLISACDTIIDYSDDSNEIANALSATLLINTIKLYETEELMMKNEFNVSYSVEVPNDRIPLFDGISAFRIGGGDMIKNMMHRLLHYRGEQNISYAILLEIVNRIHKENSVYKRMADSHISEKTRWWQNEQLFT